MSAFLSYADLNTLGGIREIDRRFIGFLAEENVELYNNLIMQRSAKNYQYNAQFVMELARYLEGFLIELFDIKDYVLELNFEYKKFVNLIWIKRNIIQRVATKKYANPSDEFSAEYDFVSQEKLVNDILPYQYRGEDIPDNILKYCAWASLSHKGRKRHIADEIFKLPQKLDFGTLLHDVEYMVPHQRKDFNHYGFTKLDNCQVGWELNYCIKCHEQEKDFCRKGIKNEDGFYKKNPLGNVLKGCPLDQKISEMIALKSQGWTIAPLSIVMIDNPLAVLTGERICNDCSKSCIYQKQTAVNIPAVETKIVDDVLNLPFGVEIYLLLAKWNPLKFDSKECGYVPKNFTDHRICIAGIGPAGIAMSYYALMNGIEVVMMDAMPISLPRESRDLIISWAEFCKDLEVRIPSGFGGVMEYGITARWDKNYLELAKILLTRFEGFKFKCVDNMRLGSGFDLDDVKNTLHCQHLSVCIGSGRPKIPTFLQNYTQGAELRGIFTASDVLMTLHLQKTFNEGVTFLPIKSPVVIVGGGLTAVDTACEVLNYLRNVGKLKEAKVRLVYHSDLVESQSYKLNEAELKNLLLEGVEIVQNFNAKEIVYNAMGGVVGLRSQDGLVIEASSVIIATGTQPNVTPLNELGITYSHLNATNCLADDSFISILGDLHPDYSGSVVKAIASAKVAIGQICSNLPSYEVKSSEINFDNFKSVVVGCDLVETGIYKLRIKSPFRAQKALPLSIFRMKVGYAGKPAILTLADIDDDILTFYVEKVGEWTSKICDLMVGEEVFLMGPMGFVINDGIDVKNVYCGDVKSGFIANAAAKYYKAEVLNGVGLGIELRNGKIFEQHKCQMNCTLGGVCGRCFEVKDGDVEFRCLKGYKEV